MIGSTFVWSLIHLMTKLFWLPYLYPKSEHCDNSFENHRQNQLPNCFKYSSTCFSSRPVWNIDIQCGVSGFIVAAKIEKSLLLEYESQTERFEEMIDHCSYTHHSIDLKKVQKEIQACMGFEPMTSAIQTCAVHSVAKDGLLENSRKIHVADIHNTKSKRKSYHNSVASSGPHWLNRCLINTLLLCLEKQIKCFIP